MHSGHSSMHAEVIHDDIPPPCSCHNICTLLQCQHSINLPLSVSQANISDKTLAVTARHYDGTLEYDVHNLYGAYEVKATAEALRAIRNKRHFIFTRYRGISDPIPASRDVCMRLFGFHSYKCKGN